MKKNTELERPKEVILSINETVDRAPILEDIVKTPIMSNTFMNMANSKKDIQTEGERSALLSMYFRDIANIVMSELYSYTLIEFTQLIASVYNEDICRMADQLKQTYDDVSMETVFDFCRILLSEMFISRYHCDDNTRKVNPPQKKSIDAGELDYFTIIMPEILSRFESRIFDIKYYLLHYNNFEELSLSITSSFISDVASRLDMARNKVYMFNLTNEQLKALTLSHMIISQTIREYSSILMGSMNSTINTLACIAREINAGCNIVNYLPRQILTNVSPIPVDYDNYLSMEKSVKETSTNRTVGFIVNRTDE